MIQRSLFNLNNSFCYFQHAFPLFTHLTDATCLPPSFSRPITLICISNALCVSTGSCIEEEKKEKDHTTTTYQILLITTCYGQLYMILYTPIQLFPYVSYKLDCVEMQYENVFTLLSLKRNIIIEPTITHSYTPPLIL